MRREEIPTVDTITCLNHNNKLENDYFTIFRRDLYKYYLGENYLVTDVKGRKLCVAELVDIIDPMLFDEESITLLLTLNYGTENVNSILRSHSYKLFPTNFVILLFRKIKKFR